MDRLKKIIQPIIIKYQHDAIKTNFDILKTVIHNHIDSENFLLDVRNEVKPDTHMDVNDKIKKHKEKHAEFLQKIYELELELDNHIKLYDIIHIHRL